MRELPALFFMLFFAIFGIVCDSSIDNFVGIFDVVAVVYVALRIHSMLLLFVVAGLGDAYYTYKRVIMQQLFL